MELVVELVGQLVGGLVLLGVAYAVGSVVFLLVRLARLGLRSLQPPPDVVDPRGRSWSVRLALAPPPLRYRVSTWLLRVRPSGRAHPVDARDPAADRVHRGEIWHPSGLVERFDEAAGLVVWVILLIALVAIVVLAFEVLLVTVIAGVVAAVRTVTSRWQCEVVAPTGERFHVAAGSLSQAREERDRLRSEIAAGVFRAPSR